jgi:hypothetical protein
MTVDGSIGELKASIVHFSYPNMHDVLEKLDRYSSGHARDMLAAGKRGGVFKAVLHGAMAFLRTYVIRLGFVDGHMASCWPSTTPNTPTTSTSN